MTNTPNTSASTAAIHCGCVTPHGPGAGCQSPKPAEYSFEYTRVGGGGERWNLSRGDAFGAYIAATVVRMPGTLTRIYFAAGGVADFATIAAAHAYLRSHYGEGVPLMPCVSDAAHGLSGDTRYVANGDGTFTDTVTGREFPRTLTDTEDRELYGPVENLS
jgi:hypothetical protein